MGDSQYICYVLVDEESRRTYCGITNNPRRRLRQHNGELVGGARYTRGRKWRYLLRVGGFRSKSEVLSFEWHLKHKSRKQRSRCALKRRRLALSALLADERWTHIKSLPTMHCEAMHSEPNQNSRPPKVECD